jgi:hypothetical protein
MSLGDPVNDYCERTSTDWTAEPLNALSNLAFFYWAWRLWREAGDGPPGLVRAQRALALLLALVGAGSLVFHTLATVWGSILDVACIGIFNVVFLVLFLRLAARWRTAWAVAGGVGFVVLDRISGALLPADAINGSLMYLPALIVLFALTAYARTLDARAGRGMAAAAGVFCVSLLARSVDQSLCTAWPPGTHWFWHLLNAWVLYTLATAMLLCARRPAAAT